MPLLVHMRCVLDAALAELVVAPAFQKRREGRGCFLWPCSCLAVSDKLLHLIMPAQFVVWQIRILTSCCMCSKSVLPALPAGLTACLPPARLLLLLAGR